MDPVSLLKKESLKSSGIVSWGFGFLTSAILIPHAQKYFSVRKQYRRKNRFYQGKFISGSLFRLEGLLPEEDDRAGQVDRRVDAFDRPDEHDEGEVVDDLAAEEKEGQEGQEDRARGDDRPAQRLVEAEVHDLFERFLAVDLGVLADPVEDDDRVVDREADDGQDAGDDGQVDLAAGERIEAHRDEDVLGQGEDGGDAVLQLEPDGDVDEHADERPDGRLGGLFPEVLADLGADGLPADDGQACRAASPAEGRDDLVGQLLVGLELLLGVGALDELRRPDLEFVALLPGLLDRAPAEADVGQGVADLADRGRGS